MPDLVIYVPFARTTDSDLKTILTPLISGPPPQALAITDRSGFDNVQVVFQGEENGQVAQGDTLVVNAHGGDGNYLDLDDNSGGTIQPANLWNPMTALGAAQAVSVIFYCCFSAEQGHVARLYKANNPNQNVYGSAVACTGPDFFTSRGGRNNRPITIHSAVWQNPGESLTEM